MSNVKVEQVKKDAEDLFRSGGFYCSEAVVASIRKTLPLKCPKN